jgi:hypothetical protein
MTRPAARVVVLLASLFVVLPAGMLLYLALRPCPYTPLWTGPGVEVVCDWWDLTCRRCT